MARLCLLVSASALGLSLAMAAHAADQPANTLTEVVVTANRTASLASKTPIAITAVTGDNLRSEGIANPTELSEVAPNVSIDRGNGIQITIRGVTSTDGTEKGDPSASFLLDGIYIARPNAQEVSFYDIDRVEVLRGPQGTLYGRNTTAGVVNVISNNPKFTYGSSLDVAYGAYNSRQVTAVTDIPVNDVLAVRAAFNYDARDSYTTQGAPSAHTPGLFTNNLSGRLGLLYKPTAKLSLLVKLDVSSMRGDGDNASEGNVLIGNFFQTPLVTPGVGQRGVNPVYLNPSSSAALQRNFADLAATRTKDSTWGVSAEANYVLNSNWTLTYLGGYRMLSRNEDGNYYIGVGFPGYFTGNYNEQSHELRLAFANDKLKAQAGLYYFREQYGIDLLLLGLLNPTPGQPGYVYGFPQTPGFSRSIGVFGQATYSVTNHLRLTAGIRSTEDEKARHGYTIVHANLTDPINYATDSLNDADVKSSKVTWKAGAEYDLAPSVLAYATVATGYKAGGFNDGCLASSPHCSGAAVKTESALFYQPETLTSYELGVKGKYFGNTLQVNADAFHYDYDNLQISQLSYVCGGPCNVTSNAAKAQVDGLELESVYLLNAQNKFEGVATFTDARYVRWLIPTGPNAATPDYVDFSGERLDRSPAFTLSGGYTFTQPLVNGGNLVANIRSKYTDRYALVSTVIRAQFWQPGYSSTDLSLTYNAPKHAWYAQAYVKNVEDNIAVTYISVSGTNGTASFSDPRTYGVRLGARF